MPPHNCKKILFSHLPRFTAYLTVWVFFCCGTAAESPEVNRPRVVILANAADSDSLQLAKFYAKMRDLPETDIVALKMPNDEAIRWEAYVKKIHNPLLSRLLVDGRISGDFRSEEDAVGRRLHRIYAHNIDYLVVCRGVPLKIWHDSAHAPSQEPAVRDNPRLNINAAAVDAELALLVHTGTPILGYVANPLYNNDEPDAKTDRSIIKVGRLDGPSVEDAKQLVHGALQAERHGLIGRGYIDLGGPYPVGDDWLRQAAAQINEIGLPHDIDAHRRTFAEWARLDGAALYFGWYTQTVNGPFLLPGFRFAPGAIALHIHSSSADTIRSAKARWVGPLIARGASALFGNVHEPLLGLTHQPQLLLKSLARGDTLGQAAAYSLPAYSWQAVTIGDPLYRPFKMPFAAQWSARDDVAEDLRPYLLLRRMNELRSRGDPYSARRLGLDFLDAHFHPAVALEVADLLLLEETDGNEARAVLGRFAEQKRFSSAHLPIAAQAAGRLVKLGATDVAVEVYERILATPDLPKLARNHWLDEALSAASGARHRVYRERWQAEKAATKEASSSP